MKKYIICFIVHFVGIMMYFMLNLPFDLPSYILGVLLGSINTCILLEGVEK